MGRPKKILDAKQVGELEKLAAILRLDQIADFFGMANSTLRRKMAEDEGIKSAYKRGKAKAVSGVGQTLLSLAKAGNITAICFYLKTQAGWRETDRMEHTGADGVPLPNTINIRLIKPEGEDGD